MSLNEPKNCYFITTMCRQHNHYFESVRAREILCNTLLNCNALHDADMLGYVIMPNHVHIVLRIADKERLIRYMHSFKTYSSAAIRQLLLMEDPVHALMLAYHKKRQKYKVWEDGYHYKEVITAGFLQQKLEYIHQNPLQEKWKLAVRPEDYRFSSAGYYYTGRQGVMEVVHYTRFFEPETRVIR